MATAPTAPATQSQIDNATLIEKVSFPTFYSHMAKAGYSPNSEQGAEQLTKLAGVVAPAVETFVARRLAAFDTAKAAAVDSALSAALEATADLYGAPAAPTTPPTSFMADPSIKAAAERLAAAQLKASGLADMMGPASEKKKEEDEEEKDEHGMPKAAKKDCPA
jgi:hypothetical protein